jgi:hypothetical protein
MCVLDLAGCELGSQAAVAIMVMNHWVSQNSSKVFLISDFRRVLNVGQT